MNIFISFYVKDWGFYDQLSAALKQSGHRNYFIDLKGRLGVEKIFDFAGLDEELRNTDLTILVLSKRYIEDPWLADELRALIALENNQRPNFLVPVLIDDLKDDEIPSYLRSKPRHDFRKSPFEVVYAQLSAQLARWPSRSSLLIFISHSHDNRDIAAALIKLLLLAFDKLSKPQIRCTSVDGFRLHLGENVDRLKVEIYEARVFIGLITPESLRSVYVLFELGARWGARRQIMPLLAGGADPDFLGGPLRSINALSCEEPEQIRQLVEDISHALNLERRVDYDVAIDDLVRVAAARPGRAAAKARGGKRAPARKSGTSGKSRR